MKRLIWSAFAACALLVTSCGDASQQLSDGFKTPPAEIQTSVYWYWISGNISREGVVADLHSMKQAGINRAFIGNIGLTENPRGPVTLMSDEWFEIVHAAMKCATELGIELGMFNSPGWSQAGGPWVKPEESMRYLSTVAAEVTGGGVVDVDLPKPSADFADVSVLAYPLPEGTLRLDAASARVGGSPLVKQVLDGDRSTAMPCVQGEDATIEVAPTAPFTLRSLRLYFTEAPIAATAELQALHDGRVSVLRRFNIDRTNNTVEVGFDRLAPITIACEPTQADAFRLIIHNPTAGSGLAEAEFLSLPLVERYSEKSLAKMHQTPLPYWHDYMWDAQPAAQDSVAAVSLQSIVDLSDQLQGDHLQWQAPAGRWMVLRTGMMPTGVRNGPALDDGIGLEIDKWSRKHLATHYDAFIGELCRRIPAADRKCWKVIVADSYERGGQNISDGFLADFESRYGYDAQPFLPVFSGMAVGSRDLSDRFLWDVRRMMADRLAYDHIGALRELAHKDGFTTWLENYGHWGFPGEFLQYGGQSDEVGGEFWSEGELGNIENRAASSCAHIYGKTKVSAESFTAAVEPFSRYPYLMKQRADRFFSEGINNTLLHVYISQPDGGRKPGMNAWFGNEFNRNNTWFSHLDLFTTYIKRCNFMLQQGLNVADVAYFIGEDVPKMTGVTDPAMPAGYQYDYINAEVLCRDASVRDGRLTLPHGTQYKVLVLPRQETMRPEVLKCVMQLIKDGAVVLGSRPFRSPSMENYPAADRQIAGLTAQLWGESKGEKQLIRYGKGMLFDGYSLEEIFAELGNVPDCGYDLSLPVLFGHRTTDDAELYFVTNQSESPLDFQADFRVTGRMPEWWQPETGAMRDLPVYRIGEKSTQVPMHLEPLESGFVVFRKAVSKSAQVGTLTDNFPQPQSLRTLDGRWKVRFEAPDSIGNFSIETDSLTDWSKSSDERLRFFSGRAFYTVSFEAPALAAGERLLLELHQVAVMAKVRVNGAYAGGVWTAPYRIDVTDVVHPGVNELEIEVVNNWVNRLVGDSRLPEAQRRTAIPYNIYTPQSALQTSGLIGPVSLAKVAF
ncbi:MAG: glycosyl hydrolase [Alistipes sp.]